MSFIDQHLMPGETVIYRTTLHWIIFWQAMLYIIIAIALFQTNFVFDLSAFNLNLNANLFGWVFLIVGIYTWLTTLLAYFNSEFAITDKRVMIKTGFIQRFSFETLLSKIEGIEVYQSIPGRVLNYGNILIWGMGGSKELFKQINDPLQFRLKVQEQIVQVQDILRR